MTQDAQNAPARGQQRLEWCEVHRVRHMAPGQGDPEPAPAMVPPHFYGDPRTTTLR